jgi:hypothetical protein
MPSAAPAAMPSVRNLRRFTCLASCGRAQQAQPRAHPLPGSVIGISSAFPRTSFCYPILAHVSRK